MMSPALPLPMAQSEHAPKGLPAKGLGLDSSEKPEENPLDYPILARLP